MLYISEVHIHIGLLFLLGNLWAVSICVLRFKGILNFRFSFLSELPPPQTSNSIHPFWSRGVCKLSLLLISRYFPLFCLPFFSFLQRFSLSLRSLNHRAVKIRVNRNSLLYTCTTRAEPFCQHLTLHWVL